MKEPGGNNKHSRHSIRLAGYDYSQPGFYFVTICTRNRDRFFANVIFGEEKQFEINELGEIARETWLEIPNHFPKVRLDEFIIMPNHIHGIIVIQEENPSDSLILRLQYEKVAKPRPYQLLPVTIGSYKSAVTRRINKLGRSDGFGWQKFYYDHIVRDNRSLERIRAYIKANPDNWRGDIENCSGEDFNGAIEHYRKLFDGEN